MAKNLTIRYDKIGDILYVDRVQPYAEQDSDEIGDGVVARFNPATREIESLEILFFSKRLEDTAVFELPVVTEFSLTDALA